MERSIKLNDVLKDGDSFVVDFPNVGQIMEIDSLKLALSNNKYSDMVRSGLKSMDATLDLIDTVAVFSILIPEFKRSLSLEDKTILELNPFDFAKQVKVYKKQFFPWYGKLMDEFFKLMNE
jgi:hypothetical protein